MGLYKPQSQFMQPHMTINNDVDNHFITRISGDICSAYIWDIPTVTQNGDSISTIELNKLIKLDNLLYNNDNLDLVLPPQSFIGGLSKYLNKDLVWNVVLVGKEKTITSSRTVATIYDKVVDTDKDEDGNIIEIKEKITIVETIIEVPNGNFKSGDMVYVSDDTNVKKNIYYVGIDKELNHKLYDTREKALATVITDTACAVNFGTRLTNKKIYSCAKSDNIPFKVINIGTLTIGEQNVDKFYHTFVPTYNQENDLIINNFQGILYDKDKQELENTGIVYSSDMKMYVESLLSDNLYYIRFIAENEIGYVYDTDYVEVHVNYLQPVIDAPFIAKNNCETTSMDLDWGHLFSIIGEIGDCYDYVEDFSDVGDTGLWLCPDSFVKYTMDERFIDIREQIDGTVHGSLPTLIWRPKDENWVGDIMQVSNSFSDEYVTIGYDGEAIYIEINGIKKRTQWFTIEEDPDNAPEMYIYLIGLTSKNSGVHKYKVNSSMRETKINNFSLIKLTNSEAIFNTNVESFAGVNKYEYYINDKIVETHNSSRLNDMFTYNEISGSMKYDAYVIVTDNIGNRIKSDILTFTSPFSNPVITSISPTRKTQSEVDLIVNTRTQRNIVIYNLRYMETSINQNNDTFKLKGLEREVYYDGTFVVTDDIMNDSLPIDYTFNTVVYPLEIIDVNVDNIGETTASFTTFFNVTMGVKSFEWIIDGEVYETTKTSIHTLTNLTPAQSYTLRVRLNDTEGNFVISREIRFTTEALPPIINNITVTPEDTNAEFDVDSDAQSGIDNYEVINNN